jgi:NAD(P)-dependent dehydrogenase (short-subunit alcohol dehydrogenase family)
MASSLEGKGVIVTGVTGNVGWGVARALRDCIIAEGPVDHIVAALGP